MRQAPSQVPKRLHPSRRRILCVGIKSLLNAVSITTVPIDVNAAQSKLVLLENFNENYSKCLRLLYKVNIVEEVNAASEEVSTAELVSTAYVIYMAPLPSRAQRHLWLRHKVEGYTEEIVQDYERRLDTIIGRQVNRVHILDFEGLTVEMRQTLTNRLRMEYTGAGGRIYDIEIGLDIADTLCFQLGMARGQAPEKQTVTNLFYLRSMDEGTRAWVARGPERQPIAAAGALEVIEGAPIVDEGVPCIPAPVQAPQPPPIAQTKTMPQRTARLKEEVHELRQSIVGLRGVVDKSITDQSRFDTWMTSCMTQLMDASGRTYQAFDNTLVGSSKIPY
ncbi:hypothetical protein Tco_1457758 [Tanacetum coccineum]